MELFTEDGVLISDNVVLADKFFKRLKGWMFKKNVENNETLLIVPCNSIHTCFMKFDMDAVFLDSENKILATYGSIKPFKLIPPVKNCHKVVELKGGVVSKMGEKLKVGNKLILK